MPVAVALVVLVPAGLLLSFGLGTLQLGDDTARGLGMRVDRSRAAPAAHGDRAVRGRHRLRRPDRLRRARRTPGLPAAGRRGPAPAVTSAVYGALLLVAADLVTRTVLPVELPVGIITSVLGAPYLIWMLARGARA